MVEMVGIDIDSQLNGGVSREQKSSPRSIGPPAPPLEAPPEADSLLTLFGFICP